MSQCQLYKVYYTYLTPLQISEFAYVTNSFDAVTINLGAVSVVSYLCRLYGVVVVWGILIAYYGSTTAPYPLFPDDRLRLLRRFAKSQRPAIGTAPYELVMS